MLKIYNTLTRKLEEFKPIEEKKVKFYHCGPTVYWRQHIGNMRGMVMADLIQGSLGYLGYQVHLVRNYTDVGHLTSDEDQGEDKFEKAKRNMLYLKCEYCDNTFSAWIQIDRNSFKKGNIVLKGNIHQCPHCHKKNKKDTKDYFFIEDCSDEKSKSPQEIAGKYIEIFEKDCRYLNMLELKPNDKPRATEYVSQMIAMVQTLLDKNFAYTTPKAIYFDVSKFKNYTQLSRQKLELNKAGAGTGKVRDEDKRNVEDFALWFFKTGVHKDALQTWKSPFVSPEVEDGEGFPGWHIECSAMSKALLGETIDIHMGGIEHIPIHHTNEIAQSEAANGVKFVNYWLHNEHLTVDGKKMAKSEGTSYSLQEIVEKGFHPLDLRYFFLGSHYRSKQNFTWEALRDTRIARKHFMRRFWVLAKSKGEVIEKYKEQFVAAIVNEFNIPQALAVAWNLIKSDEEENNIRETLLDFDKVFGLNLEEICEVAREILEPKHLEQLKLDQFKKDRDIARKSKDWAKADELREKIEQKGFTVEDSKEGTRILRK